MQFPRLLTTFNSRIPAGQNDGALWQGRGLNSFFTVGAELTGPFFSASFRPEFVFSQNRDFELSRFPPRDSYSVYVSPSIGNPSIDRPQRFGENSLSRLYPGRSWARIQYEGIAAGVSTEQLWSGPALQNPIVFSNNAPGFFYVFIGTYKPLITPIGNVEFRFLGGRLKESDFFDDDPDNDNRFINAINLNYSPSFIPGLHVGAIRMIQRVHPENGLSFSDITEVFQPFLKESLRDEENPSGNLGSHQLFSLFARKVFPSYGLELFAEWGRNDHSGDDRDLLRHFEHTRFYTLGFLKTFRLTDTQWITTHVEMTQLEVPRLHEWRKTGSVYNNGEVIQGFTHRGQVIGAGIGPGSNSQLIRVQYLNPDGLMGFSLNRVTHHNDRLYQLYQRGLLTRENEAREHHTVEFRFGVHLLRFLPARNLEIAADLYFSRFLNYDYEVDVNLNNLNIQAGIRYLF